MQAAQIDKPQPSKTETFLTCAEKQEEKRKYNNPNV